MHHATRTTQHAPLNTHYSTHTPLNMHHSTLSRRYNIFRTALELLEAIGADDSASGSGDAESTESTDANATRPRAAGTGAQVALASATVVDGPSILATIEAAVQTSERVETECATLRSEVADLRSQVASVLAENETLKRTLQLILQRLDGGAVAHSSDDSSEQEPRLSVTTESKQSDASAEQIVTVGDADIGDADA
jgi:regulator of replication initiation timing